MQEVAKYIASAVVRLINGHSVSSELSNECTVRYIYTETTKEIEGWTRVRFLLISVDMTLSMYVLWEVLYN